MRPRVEIVGLSTGETARLRSSRRLAAALAALPPETSSARVTFADDNGPKGGPAMRCALTVSMPPRRRIHVEARALTTRLALDAALDRLERRLFRSEEILRESRRRPKKYYAAGRARASVR
jgi:ribosome-associated translation inhibitor RaiA